jgi:glutamyl-tRNA reductase
MIERFAVIGITETAPLLSARRRMALEPTWTQHLLEQAHGRFGGAVVLATCERFEVYVDAGPLDLRELGAEFESAVMRRGNTAATHLFRVSAGLESRILGEPHILGQVADAIDADATRGKAGPFLTEVFHAALRAGRRVRSETLLGRLARSYVTAAVDRVTAVHGDGRSAAVGVIGSGAVARDLVLELRRRSVARVTVFARHLDRALRNLGPALAGVKLAPLSELPLVLPELDALITATSSPHTALGTEHVARRATPLTVVDLGMPPNTADSLTTLPHVKLHRLWDLDSGSGPAPAALAQAEGIVSQELTRLAARLRLWHHDAIALEAVA